MNMEEEYSYCPYRILVWPDSLIRCQYDNSFNKPGFLIGWSYSLTNHHHDEGDDDGNDRTRRLFPSSSFSASAGAACYPPMLVVAGLVQMQDDDGHDGGSKQQQQQQQQLRACIEDRIQKIQTSLLKKSIQRSTHSSFSQPDDGSKDKTDTTNPSPITDADAGIGVQHHHHNTSCWNDLSVIAWYDPEPATTSSSSLAASTTAADAPSPAAAIRLPRISLMKATTSAKNDDGAVAAGVQNKYYRYVPWFVLNHGQHDITDECQVIFYDDGDSTIYNTSNSCCASPSSSSTMSFFSLLPRITQASQIMKIIQSPEDDEARRILGDTTCNIIQTETDHLHDSSIVDKNSRDQTVKQETNPDPSLSGEMDDSFWRRAFRFVYKRSFLLLILRQLANNNNSNPTRAIPLLRFVDALKLHMQLVHQQQQQEELGEEQQNQSVVAVRHGRPNTDDEAKNNKNSNLCCCWPDSKHKRMQRLVHCWDEVVLAGLDAVMGIILALIIIRAYWSNFALDDPVAFANVTSSSSSSSWLPEVMIKFHFQFLWDSTVWLESFPIGFKLNEQLTANLGHKIRSLLTLYQWMLLQIMTRNTLVVQAGATIISSFIALVFGAFGFVALFMDVFRCAMVHVSFFSYLFRSMVRAELYLLAALWRLFRGKKRNPLRHRTDTMEYDSLQLLVGIIVFSVSLFLFTTIGIYHAFFAALNLVMVVSVSFTCTLLCILLWKKFPWGRLLLRYYHPGWFTNRVYLAVEMHHDMVASTMKSNKVTSMAIDVTRLQTIPCSYSSILMGGLVHRNPAMSNLTAWLLKQLLDPLLSVPSLLHDDDHCLASVFEALMEPGEGVAETNFH